MSELKKSLTTVRGAGLMLNIVIGAGLLALPGLAYQDVGTHALWSWLMCAFLAVPLLTVFITVGRRYPNAGGIAHFADLAFGSTGYIVASLLFLGAVIFGLPAIALTGGHYLASLFSGNPVFFAIILILGGSAIQFLSPEVAGRISTFTASGILLSLLGLIAIGLFSINWEEIPANTLPANGFDIALILSPFMMIFFAFTGWEVAASISEEFKNPSRDFPRAMGLSFGLACFLYFTMAFIVQNSGVTEAFEASFVTIASTVLGQFGGAAVAILAGIIIFANLMGAIWAVSRMVFSLSREGYLPFILNVNEGGAPVSSVAITVLCLMVVLGCEWMGLIDIVNMLSIAGQNFLLLYCVAALALLKLSNKVFDRAASIVTVGIVVALIIVEGTTLMYPLVITLLGFAIGARQHTKERAQS